MAVDPYSPCPGGTGKKIKFCCNDFMPELDQIRRMLEGEQRLACLDLVNKSQAKHGDRACLLAVKSMLEGQLGNMEAAETTVQTFIAKHPDNPVALAEQAILKAAQGDSRSAIDSLVRAIEISGESMPARVYEAITPLATMLLSQGEILTARALLLVQAEIAGSEDTRPVSLLMRILNSPQVPLIMKEDPAWAPPPEGVAWKSEFEEALMLALRGAWRAGADRFRKLADKAGDHAAIWKNLSVLYAWLAERDEASSALRKYAALDVPRDDAVEAEALAQVLGEDAIGPEIDVLSVVYNVGDLQALESRLHGNRTMHLGIDLAGVVAEGEPPPREALWLLDRPLPSTGVGITLEAVPHVVATLYLFGKQTDREARIEMTVTRPDLAKAQEALREIAGDTLGSEVEQRVTTSMPATTQTLSWNWQLPPDTPRDLRQSLVDQQRRQILFERWPRTPMRLFGGKTPEEAAKDSANHIKLLATILLMELTDSEDHLTSDYNELRRKLGLPTSETIEADEQTAVTMPHVRLARLDMTKLSDDALVQVYRRASLVRAEAALRKAAQEILKRPSLDSKVDKSETYGLLARLEDDLDQAITYIGEARTITEKAGKSTARWDLEELSMQIQRESAPDVGRLVQHIRDDHMREPGVAQALVSILSEAGLVGPDGSMAGPVEEKPSGIVVPGGAASAGKLWTPDSAQPTGQKQGIWTPD